MGSVKAISDDQHFQSELQQATGRLVVVDFTAPWCGPCQRMAPVFKHLAAKYFKAVFLKIDVDECREIALSQGVSAMPSFIFYRNHTKLDHLEGADPTVLESKIVQYYGTDAQDNAESLLGSMDLSTFIIKSQCECLNESDEHPLSNALTPDDGFLQSDCDEQLIISIAFNQVVKIQSLIIKSPADKGPKDVKIFINQPRTLDFDMAESFICVQELKLTPKHLEGEPIDLLYVKFQNVNNIHLFIKNNQGNGSVTQINHIGINGAPIATTNMGDLKKIAGKKCENH